MKWGRVKEHFNLFQVVLVAGDIADESVRNNLIESAVSNFNELNILVNEKRQEMTHKLQRYQIFF